MPSPQSRVIAAAAAGRPTSLARWVADQLADLIIEGTLAGGVPLRESQIARQFAVSPTPVREALRILEREDLVTATPHRGARVSVITAEEADHIYVCRVALEGLSYRLATRRLREQDLARLDTVVDQMRGAVTRRDPAGYHRLNVELTAIVHGANGNPCLQNLIHILSRRVLRLRRASVGLPGRLRASYAGYREILRAFRARDAVRAERTIRHVLDGARAAIVAHLRAQERAGAAVPAAAPRRRSRR